ncbi:MAG: NosD domain-containing protein [Kiritimatiellia bacterium]
MKAGLKHLMIFASALLWAQCILAQGLLMPAGAPAPSMKTLYQIHQQTLLSEPRTALSAINTPGSSGYHYAITNSGSYYLTDNMTVTQGGISVSADHVALDLNGFTLTGNPLDVSHYGIYIGNVRNVEVRNGTVAQFGANGVYAYESMLSSQPRAHRVTGLRIINNGGIGIYFPTEGCILDGVTVVSNSSIGIEIGNCGQVEECIVYGNGYWGIYAGEGCVVSGNASCGNGSSGIVAGDSSLIQGNVASENAKNGISGGDYNRIGENVCMHNAEWGIYASTGCSVHNNTIGNNNSLRDPDCGGLSASLSCHVAGNNVSWNWINGIHVNNARNCIENNLITGSDTGIVFSAAGNVYADNRFSVLSTNIAGTATDGGGNISF